MECIDDAMWDCGVPTLNFGSGVAFVLSVSAQFERKCSATTPPFLRGAGRTSAFLAPAEPSARAALSGHEDFDRAKLSVMSLVALRPLDVAIFGTMGGLWIFGAAFIYFVWRWVMRTEQERTNPVMLARDAPIPPAPLTDKGAATARDAHSRNDLGSGLPTPAST